MHLPIEYALYTNYPKCMMQTITYIVKIMEKKQLLCEASFFSLEEAESYLVQSMVELVQQTYTNLSEQTTLYQHDDWFTNCEIQPSHRTQSDLGFYLNQYRKQVTWKIVHQKTRFH